MSEEKPSEALALLRALVLLVGVQLLPMLVSGRWRWIEAWVFVVLQLGSFVVSRAIIARKNPDLLYERAHSLDKDDAKPWDRTVVLLMVGASTLALVVAGLEARWNSAPVYSLTSKSIAVALMIVGLSFGSWAIVENRFFSGLVRIQRERGHTVVTTGPYAYVRHPGYASSVLNSLGMVVLLDGVWAFVPMFLSIGLLVFRTHLEDETLQRELDGYVEYTKKTRYRLLPGVW